MANLSEPIQIYIVTALATYVGPAEVIRQVREVFGVDTTMLQIIHYDASRPYYKGAKKWTDLFNKTRAQWLARAARDGLARQEVRIHHLERLAQKAEQQGNLRLAADIYKQAAEDAGGVYTNTRKVVGDPRAALSSLLGVNPSEIPARNANEWAASGPPLPPAVNKAVEERSKGTPMDQTTLAKGVN